MYHIISCMTHTALRSFIRYTLNESAALDEGGNVIVGGKSADKIEIAKVHRDRFVKDLRALFRNLDKRYTEFTSKLGDTQHLYRPDAIETILAGIGFGGSSGAFFDLESHDELFASKKKMLGDIDVYIPRETYVNLFSMLQELEGKRVLDLPDNRSIDYVGQIDAAAVGNQINSLFVYSFLDEDSKQPAQLNMQIDFVKTRFTEEGIPHSSIVHSHGSSPDDMMLGIKGFAKNYLIAAITSKLTRVPGKKATPSSTKDKIKISKSGDSDEIALYTFSVDYGFRHARELLGRVEDVDVYIDIKASDETTLQTSQGFKMLFGVEPTPDELRQFHSFSGTLQLMKKYMSDKIVGGKPLYESVFELLFYKCFSVDIKTIPPDDIRITLAYSTERTNFSLDRDVKMAMIDAYYDAFPELLSRKNEFDQKIERYYEYLPIWANKSEEK
jgi:hypothetical protein